MRSVGIHCGLRNRIWTQMQAGHGSGQVKSLYTQKYKATTESRGGRSRAIQQREMKAPQEQGPTSLKGN